MSDFNNIFQSADWKSEKHVPVIEAPDQIKKGEPTTIKVSVGKEIKHPNKTEHHIKWISVYFHPENEKFPYQIGHIEFSAHGASINGPDTSTVYSEPVAVINFLTEKPGTIFATSFCNIHGLWQNSLSIK